MSVLVRSIAYLVILKKGKDANELDGAHVASVLSVGT